MKKKILTFILAFCMMLPCAFMLSACGNDNCDHHLGGYISKLPTLEEAGEFYCSRCEKAVTLPILNTTDYTKNDNPDYVVYTYTFNENNEFNIVEHSNFEIDTYNDGLQYKIVKYTGNNAIVTIPDVFYTYESYEWLEDGCYANISIIIDKIADDAFKDNANLEELVIPEWTDCGVCSFSGCSSLKKLTMPRYSGMFYNLFGDSASDVPASLKEVVLTKKASVFDGCENIEKITVLNGESIGRYIGCTSLKEITLSPLVTSIGEDTFNGCSSLTDIIIPASVTNLTIQSGALAGCSNANIYYLGSKSNINIDDEDEYIKMIYYYSNTAPSGVEYLNNKKGVDTWHYSDSNE